MAAQMLMVCTGSLLRTSVGCGTEADGRWWWVGGSLSGLRHCCVTRFPAK